MPSLPLHWSSILYHLPFLAFKSRSSLFQTVIFRSTRTKTATTTTAAMATIATTGRRRDYVRKSRRFAPLDPAATALSSSDGNDAPRPPLKGIVFDVDGTLCLPQNYMFLEMRAALNIPKSVDILDHIQSLSDEPDINVSSLRSPSPNPGETLTSTRRTPPPPTSPRAVAIAKVKAIENNAMTSQRPQPGLEELMAYLSRRGVRKALCTRNFPGPVHHLLEKYLPGEEFDPIITRETEGVSPKPSPEGLWRIADTWGLGLDETGTRKNRVDGARDPNDKEVDVLELARRYLGSGLIMVGDSIDDMASGYRAGAATVLLVNDENEELAGHEYTDLSIRRLDELVDILEKGFEGRS